MSIISQPEIEQMTEQELREKFYEIFNALARKQSLIDECDQLQASLQRLQIAIYNRNARLLK